MTTGGLRSISLRSISNTPFSVKPLLGSLWWWDLPGHHDASVIAFWLPVLSHPYIPIKGLRLPHRGLLCVGWSKLNLIFFLSFSVISCLFLGSFLCSLPIPFHSSFFCFLFMSFTALLCPSHSYVSPPPLVSFPVLLSMSSSSSQWFSPLSCHQLLGPGLLRLGRLWLRSPSHTALAPGLWLSGFGLLRGDHLFLCPAPGPGPPAPEDMVHLRRLQEISEQWWGLGRRVAMVGGRGPSSIWGSLWETAEHRGFRHKLWSHTAQF